LDRSDLTFTSADTGQGSFFDGAGPETAGEGESPAADDGGAQREVVEPDVIRRQEGLLYVLNQYRGLSIIDLDNQTLLAQVPTLGYPRDLYFAGGQAYVLVSYAQDISIENGDIAVATASRLYAVDVTEPAAAAIRSSIDLPGDLVDSRMVGDILYAVSAEYDYYYGYFEDIAYAGNVASTTVSSIDVSDPDAIAMVDAVEFDGSSTVIHVTPEFAFVASPDWQRNSTEITCLNIQDPLGTLQSVGTVRVRGYVDDKFKMDAWNGALRVVSNVWEGTRQVYLSTFDLTQAELPMFAEMSLEGAEGETLFATRFDGPRAYVVTFLVVDPLFVIDVSDPAAPAVLGALEVPGYSTYIEPRGDRLIALGVDNTNGQKISVSIFDVSGNAAPSLVDRVSFGEEWAWSNAYSDVKALTILDDVIIVPFSGWSGYAGGYDRLQFVSYTADDLQLRGAVDLSGSILRSFDYDGYFYGVTTEQVTRVDGADLDNPGAVSSVTIAENLVDFIPVAGNLGAEIVSRYDEGQIVVRTVDDEGVPLGELVMEIGEFFGAYPEGDSLTVVGVSRNESAGYTVAVVDLVNPATPALLHTIDVDVYPYYGYYYYDYGFGGPEIGIPGADRGVAAKDVAVGYPYDYGGAGEMAFRLGNKLVLRCYSDRFDTTLGDETAYEGLAVIDLDTGTWDVTIGLGYAYLVSLNSAGDRLYATTKESVGTLPFQRPMTSYFIREIDVEAGVERTAANVPGAFVQYNPDTDILVLNDHQWTSTGELTSSLETVRWSGGSNVTPLDSIEVANYSTRILAAGDRVYFDSYDAAYQVQQVVVGGNGELSSGSALRLDGIYGNLVGARGDDLFIGLGYSALAHYTFNNGTPTFVELVPLSGYPSTVRFGENTAYFPLGYYGLVTLSLDE